MTRAECRKRTLRILADLLEGVRELPEGETLRENIVGNVYVGDHERAEIEVDELITEFRRRSAGVGPGPFGNEEQR